MTEAPEVLTPSQEAYVRGIYDRSPFTNALGLRVLHLAKGTTEVTLSVRPDHRQQDGFVHAGVLASLADHNAGGCGATMAPEGAGILSIEFKINMLRPSLGPELYGRATSLRAGRTVSVVESEVYDRREDGKQVLVAKATVTLAVRSS